MARFVFRAQAALDLRRRRDDDARRDLASAHAALVQAETALDEALAYEAQAIRDARSAAASADGALPLEWHRNWIISRKHDVARRRGDLEDRRSQADAARARATRTHMEVRVLEKLETRARRTHLAAEAREEQKGIDWLAILRSTSRQREREAGR